MSKKTKRAGVTIGVEPVDDFLHALVRELDAEPLYALAREGSLPAQAEWFRREARRQSDPAPAQDEQHQGDDRKDDQDRPQHGHGGSPVEFYTNPDGTRGWHEDNPPVSVTLEGQTWRMVTPEIQAVLDALPGWLEWENRLTGSPVMDPRQAAMYHAAAAYVGPTVPDVPSTVNIANWALDGEWKKVQEAIHGDPVLAIDVLCAMCDVRHRADTVFANAAQLTKCLEAIDV